MQETISIFRNAKLADGTISVIVVKNGKILEIGHDGNSVLVADRVVDLQSALVVPGFVEGHIHLDTSFYGDTWRSHTACTAGFDVRERVEIQRRNMADAAPMEVRARNQLNLCIANGSTQMRSHVMVDASVGLKSLETILQVREEYRERIDIQLVAFPQSGIITCPGTRDLLDAACELGCDLIGGLDPASIDRDIQAHLDIVFGIAEKRDVGVDIHLHEPGQLGIFVLEEIATRTRALGLHGRVAVSHAYALGEVPIHTVRRTAEILATAGVAIMTNAPGSHSFPPVLELRQAGVTVFSGSDNIRDSWWPYGDGDMLSRAMLIGYRSGFFTDEELAVSFDLVTTSGAKALGLHDYGLHVGAAADFVTFSAAHIPEAVVSLPKPRTVYKAGKCVATNGAVTS